MKNASKLVALSIAALAAMSSSYAGTFENLKVGDVVPAGTTIGGKLLKIADGDAWVKAPRRANLRQSGAVDIEGEDAQRPGIAFMNLMSDGEIIARRSVSTIKPRELTNAADHSSCTKGEYDVARMFASGSDILCAGVQARPADGGYTIRVDRLDVTTERYVRDIVTFEKPIADKTAMLEKSVRSTLWLTSPAHKDVSSIVLSTH